MAMTRQALRSSTKGLPTTKRGFGARKFDWHGMANSDQIWHVLTKEQLGYATSKEIKALLDKGDTDALREIFPDKSDLQEDEFLTHVREFVKTGRQAGGTTQEMAFYAARKWGRENVGTKEAPVYGQPHPKDSGVWEDANGDPIDGRGFGIEKCKAPEGKDIEFTFNDEKVHIPAGGVAIAFVMLTEQELQESNERSESAKAKHAQRKATGLKADGTPLKVSAVNGNLGHTDTDTENEELAQQEESEAQESTPEPTPAPKPEKHRKGRPNR